MPALFISFLSACSFLCSNSALVFSPAKPFFFCKASALLVSVQGGIGTMCEAIAPLATYRRSRSHAPETRFLVVQNSRFSGEKIGFLGFSDSLLAGDCFSGKTALHGVPLPRARRAWGMTSLSLTFLPQPLARCYCRFYSYHSLIRAIRVENVR